MRSRNFHRHPELVSGSHMLCTQHEGQLPYGMLKQVQHGVHFNIFVIEITSTMKKLLLYTTCIVALSACHTKTDKHVTDSVAVYHVPEEKAINQTVDDAYAAICFKKGEQPRYDDIRKAFIPKAQLINFRGDTAQVTNLEQFIYLYRTVVESDSLQSFYEKELYGKTEQFGKIAERISTYKTTLVGKTTEYERGVNSFQLIKTPGGWKVSSIIWDVEKKALPVPGYYLGNK